MSKFRPLAGFFPGLLCAAVMALAACSSDNAGGDSDYDPNGSPDCQLLSFSFSTVNNSHLSSQVRFSVDHDKGTVTAACLDWIDSAEPDRFVATFSIKGKRVLVGNTEQVSGQTVNSFRDEVVYVVRAENGDRKEYRVRLVCPQANAEIPVLHLRPSAPVVNKTTYIKTKLDIIGNGITEGLWDSSMADVEVRLRGNSTMGLPKKPYRIKFPEKYSPLGLKHAKAKSWTLLANDCDKTLLRNAAALAMSRVLFSRSDGYHDSRAVLFTAATMHVNVYMDGRYIGLYQMSDQLQKDDGRINIETLKEKDGNDPAKITGGYLLEVDIHASTSSEPYYFPSSKGIKITPKYPEDDDHHSSQYEYIRNYLTTAETALYGSGFADPAGGWRKYWDEASAVDFFLINELTGNPDGFTSIYLYKKRDCGKFFFGPVWDFDKAYNNDKRTVNPLTNLMVKVGFFTMAPGYAKTNWHGRMLEDPSFKAAVKARWAQVKDRMLNAALGAMDADYAKMPMSVEANFTRWNITEQALTDAMPPPASYKAGFDGLKKYLKDRYAFLDATFGSW